MIFITDRQLIGHGYLAKANVLSLLLFGYTNVIDKNLSLVTQLAIRLLGYKAIGL